MANIKLNPPQIETSLPPMVVGTTNANLIIPLYPNPSVAIGDVDGISIIIKTISNNTEKDHKIMMRSWQSFEQNIKLVFNAADYVIGQYYKLQMAYITKNSSGKDIIGYYSSVGIFKCTKAPSVTIANLQTVDSNNNTVVNSNPDNFIGLYSNDDISEKVYSYCFTIYDDNNNIFDTSGVLLHNVNNDTNSFGSEDAWVPKKSFVQRKNYYITYDITTINGVTASSPRYVINTTQESFIPTDGEFIATLNSDDGCVSLDFKNLEGKFIMLEAGDYVITRSSSKDNFEYWVKLIDYILPQHTENVHFYNDTSVEQGVTYRYGLQLVQPSGNLSARKIALCYMSSSDQQNNIKVDSLKVDFEDAFLSDGERQLCIRYNPKIASFKSTILENKVDTLGGKYPFIFRNGNVNYKEFSISGLISMLMDANAQFMPMATGDEEQRFITPGDETLDTSPLTNLNGDNFEKERNFKMEVLAWLTNGKPKLFRSSAEGNFIVRLMNVSLSPNDTLGRMLHTFNCTAYEVADFTIENLLRHNLLRNRIEVEMQKIMIFNHYRVSGYQELSSTISGLERVKYLSFEGVHSPQLVTINWSGNDVTWQKFDIGNVTGKYTLHIPDNISIREMYLSGNNNFTYITCGQYRQDLNVSRNYRPYTISNESVVQQYLGNTYYTTVENGEEKTRIYSTQDILEMLTSKSDNKKTEVNYCYLLRISPKPVINVAWSWQDSKWRYASVNGTVSDIEVPLNDVTIYHKINQTNDDKEHNRSHFIHFKLSGENSLYAYLEGEPNYTFTLNNKTYSLVEPQVIDIQVKNGQLLADKNIIPLSDENTRVLTIANNNQDMVHIDEFITSGRFDTLTDVGELKQLVVGNGLICDIVYEAYHYNYE